MPACAVALAGAVARLVKLNKAGGPTPIETETVKLPTVVLAVKPGAVAMPVAAVTAVAVLLPVKAPPAPLAGAVKVTVAPLTGLPKLSMTSACKVWA